MIDDDKITKAASELCDYGSVLSSEYRIEGFKKCAKWMQEEFLKDLWHSASEEPKKVKNLLLETTYEYGKPIYHLIKYMPNGNNVCAWREWYKGAHISRWLYIDDLLPKEGGNHD